MAKLATPVEVFGEKHAVQVDTVTFSAKGAGIGPGQFRDFGLSVGLPDRPGTTLAFKALQTYSDGDVVRWIGTPDADKPAPRVELTGAAKPAAAAAKGDDGMTTVALVVGGLGLLAAGLAGLAFGRRTRVAAANGRPRTA